MSDKLTTESYKGVRDFYPEDKFLQNYIFNVWTTVTESFGYVEYSASLLEPSELYKSKSGEEIVNEQTYTFKDRGDREITLRPEMTPTVARLVAGKMRELSFPLRWYSIPNLFRYEKPQRGRLREHWQLNVDLFGVDNTLADVEILCVAYQIMKKFGAKDEDFVIRLNSRKIINALYEVFKLSKEDSQKVSKIIDKKDKISPEIYTQSLEEILKDKTHDFLTALASNEKILMAIGAESDPDAKELVSLIEKLDAAGIKNVLFDPTLMRGFDYYTGIVFEIFDTSPENNRSVFGGGRYDELLDIFGADKIPAIGFGAGDVTIEDFLRTHNLLPEYRPSADIYIATLSPEMLAHAQSVATELRKEGVNVAVDLSQKKIGDQVKIADRQQIPFVIAIGDIEMKSGLYGVKNMKTGEEVKVRIGEIPKLITNYSL